MHPVNNLGRDTEGIMANPQKLLYPIPFEHFGWHFQRRRLSSNTVEVKMIYVY